MSSIDGDSNVPRNMVEKVADTMISTAQETLAAMGIEVENILVCLRMKGTDEEKDTVVAGWGFENGRDLIAELLMYTKSMVKQLGINMAVIPVRRRAKRYE